VKNLNKRLNQSERILLTAFECISSRGYANTSMRDIADLAKVALSQLNYHYKSKDGLFIEVINYTMDKYLNDIEQNIMIGNTPKERMKNLLQYFNEMIERNPSLFRLLYDFTSLALWKPDFEIVLKRLFSKTSQLIEVNILVDDHLKTQMKQFSSKEISKMLTGAMFGTAIQMLLEPKETETPKALNAIELILT